jgi:hypothetical protein
LIDNSDFVANGGWKYSGQRITFPPDFNGDVESLSITPIGSGKYKVSLSVNGWAIGMTISDCKEPPDVNAIRAVLANMLKADSPYSDKQSQPPVD